MLNASTSNPVLRLPRETFRWDRLRLPWATVRRHWVAFISGGILLLAVLSAAFAPALAPHDPNKVSMRQALQGPSRDYLLGTDQLGRDQLSRLLYGGSKTLTMAGLAMLGTVSLGLFFGVLAGYFGGKIDFVISQIMNVLLSLPSLLLALAILGVMGPGTTSLQLALIGASWVGHARIFRAAILSLREQVYVESAVSLGASPARIMLRHLLPNLVTTIAVLATLDLGVMILTITSLSFLGLGVQPPTADWGTMLNEARSYFGQYPLLGIAPGVCITVVVLASNFLGDAIRDLVDKGR
jgi:ABC-type dipeptide/oligopeptide/nickel transport system permease subunit